MFRTNVYIDGFNLYHAICELNDEHLKWVDLHLLSRNILNKYQELGTVTYFSAYATWRPDSYKRHRSYVAALQERGVRTIMGRFKEKRVTCQAACKQPYTTHEEKETDVNIASHLIADTLHRKFDTALVVTADTDIASAVRLARSFATAHMRINTVAPPGRFANGRELDHLFEITKGKLRASLLPEKIRTSIIPQ